MFCLSVSESLDLSVSLSLSLSLCFSLDLWLAGSQALSARSFFGKLPCRCHHYRCISTRAYLPACLPVCLSFYLFVCVCVCLSVWLTGWQAGRLTFWFCEMAHHRSRSAVWGKRSIELLSSGFTKDELLPFRVRTRYVLALSQLRIASPAAFPVPSRTSRDTTTMTTTTTSRRDCYNTRCSSGGSV